MALRVRVVELCNPEDEEENHLSSSPLNLASSNLVAVQMLVFPVTICKRLLLSTLLHLGGRVLENQGWLMILQPRRRGRGIGELNPAADSSYFTNVP